MMAGRQGVPQYQPSSAENDDGFVVAGLGGQQQGLRQVRINIHPLPVRLEMLLAWREYSCTGSVSSIRRGCLFVRPTVAV